MIITVPEQKGNELIKTIHDVIIKMLQSAKQLVDFDKEVAAGLYTYAIEEFGKLLLVKGSKLANNLYEINNDWFKKHKDKFPIAFDYLQENNHGLCITLTSGNFDPRHFHWQNFMIGHPADFESRLAIFYSGINSKGKNDIDIIKVPSVDKDMLTNAINEFEDVINKLT